MHIRFHVDSDDALRAFERAPEAMERSLERYLGRGADAVAREGMRGAPKAFSTLVQSIRAFRVAPLHWRAAPGVHYAPHVELGTRAHFPNPLALQPWVQRVLGVRGAEAREKAYLIARAISRRGTRAQPYMRPAAEKMESRVFELMRQGVEEGLREAFSR